MAVETTTRGPIQASTKFLGFGGPPGGAATANNAAAVSPGLVQAALADKPSPVTVLVGILVFLALLKWVGESPRTSIDPAHVSIGPYNILTVTAVAVIGIAVGKLIFNRWQVPGFTPLFNFI